MQTQQSIQETCRHNGRNSRPESQTVNVRSPPPPLVLLIPAVTKMVQHTQLLTNREMLQDNVAGQLQISKYSMLIVRTQ